MSNENSNDNSNDNANENINENSNENITFFLKEKDVNKRTNDDEITQMMEELNEHINAAELELNLNPWIINDDAEEDINPFFNGALLLYKE